MVPHNPSTHVSALLLILVVLSSSPSYPPLLPRCLSRSSERCDRHPSPCVAAPAQVEGADFRFQERMRGVIEYMQYREMPAEIKRKVGPSSFGASIHHPASSYSFSAQHSVPISHPPPFHPPLRFYLFTRRCGASSRSAGGSRRSCSTSRASCGTCTGRSGPGFCGTWAQKYGHSSRCCRRAHDL